ncbi:beta-lactamase/transpeptidase-like protein [Xylaria bambusicola]|uniref:beta-lactamase/transpeptidase-like protein n=1 Tax=Xylaria bambusicola TaxID=326684 RepID=UPI0020076063|nr:beta-lactamase/transpeptidase-like protein [Xylaria bambusicola]KAI0509418.1 beta-lactamase/transpeptidase-like protein [Xylaria bambusicola]
MSFNSKIFGLLVLATYVLGTTCPLAGPGFPSSAHLSNSSALSQSIAKFEKLSRSTSLKGNDAAWAVALFSSRENKTLYEHYYTPPVDIGVSRVDRDSIFRIGSVTKVFSVWSFLIEAGDEYFHEPVTKYIPELANSSCAKGANQQEVYNDIDCIRWNEVTLGQLASQSAGIPRDPTYNDLGAELDFAQAAAFGFPVLEKPEIPICGAPGTNRTCTRTEMFSYLLRQHPSYPTAQSPAYSNIAFALLGYAQQAITGAPIGGAITNNILKALGMSHSSYKDIPSHGGVIPGGDPTAVGWDEKLGLNSPAGSMYSSTSDMIKAGQALLQSKLLSPAQTRRWLKPLAQTGYLSTAVGAPWEIRYLTLSDNRISQLYTKQGDEGNYHAALVLSPEHDLGWIVLTAGVPTVNVASVRDTLLNVFGDYFLPMAEQQAAEEAKSNFVGTFVDEASNSSAVIEVGPSDSPGLLVRKLVSRGVQVVGPESPLIQLYGAGQYARLYPSNLRATSLSKSGCRTYDSRLGFRATFFNATEPGKVEDPCLEAWTALGAPTYGQVALDDWVFEIGEDGRAQSLDVRLLRLKMKRV